ncbi:DUF3667 domain-containing protein [Flavivirga abyssicola]|uniref:DUF3667 domain-containing protein n=1 Tax=Flavivirga abyssicola TaxID=3063533 RepID=UPI0026E0E67D|nr:DUF3667 domain-containing protein [Flavivirga sp. MEBiC07777]WVK12265.1 DUF3667 domain-containing protein [Flavivirga sp. MEBiC07777]
MQCKNCNKDLNPEINFCGFCGAKVIRNRLTIKNLFEHFSKTFLNYDNKLLQTFIKLFTKPEVIIESYIHGTRKKHVNVISYFAIALTLSGFQMFVSNKFFPELMNVDFLAQKGAEDFQRNNMNFVQEYQSIVYMLIVPGYALISKIIFFDFKKYNYTEHLVANMYITAHLSICSSILVILALFFGVNFGIIGLLSIPVQILCTAYYFKRLLNLDFKTILLKTIFFLLILTVLFIMFSLFIAIIMYYNGTLDQIKEAQKAAVIT